MPRPEGRSIDDELQWTSMTCPFARARSYVCDACVNITHPSKVRDALDFDYSIVREQRIGISAIPKLFGSWVELNGIEPSTSGLQSPRSPS